MSKKLSELEIQEALGTLNQSIDRVTARALIRELNTAIQMVVERNGLKVTKECSGRFSSTLFRINFEVGIRMRNGKSSEQIQFELCSLKRQYPTNWFGQTVVLGGVSYIIVGVNPRSNKQCIKLNRSSDGKPYKATVSQIASALGGK